MDVTPIRKNKLTTESNFKFFILSLFRGSIQNYCIELLQNMISIIINNMFQYCPVASRWQKISRTYKESDISPTIFINTHSNRNPGTPNVKKINYIYINKE
jgi:hypothetical protein